MFNVKGFMMWLYTFAAIVSSGGVQGFSLSSSPSSEDGIISVCPATTVTLTCTASGVGSMTWRDRREIHAFLVMDYDNEETRVVHEGPYTLNLTTIDNRIDPRADFISTLTVMVDDIVSGINISCLVFMKRDHLVINKRSPPSSPYNMTVKTDSYQTDNFSIIISWESGEDEVVVLEGVYNIPLEIRVSAINCAGTSAEVTKEVFVAGCGPPSPPVNGSVGEWTSSRVEAQVTYSCDTHLVLVGETMATCSLPSLTWQPSSGDVTCVHPPEGDVAKESSIPVAAITAPTVISIFIVVVVVIALGVYFLRRYYSSRRVALLRDDLVIMRGTPQATDENSYDDREGFMSPNSQHMTTALSSRSPTHHSDLEGSHAPATAADAVLLYSEVNRTQGVSTNGSPSYAYAMYSETSDTTCMVTVSDDSQAQSTSHQTSMSVVYPTPNTGQNTSPHKPVQEKYAQLAFNEPVTLLPSLGLNDQPVQYSVVHPSTKGPPPLVPSPHSSSQPPRAPEGDKHPLDQSITIDMAIQQLQQLTPYWWTVGEAAGIRRATLKKIRTHYKGNDKESFAEVMNHIFIPDHTTWTQLAGVCEGAGFTDLANALLDSYTTGMLPIQIDEDSNTAQHPPTRPAPPIPPRGGIEDEEDQDLPPTALPSASLTDPLPPTFPPSDKAPPPRPPKVTKPPPRPPKH